MENNLLNFIIETLKSNENKFYDVTIELDKLGNLCVFGHAFIPYEPAETAELIKLDKFTDILSKVFSDVCIKNDLYDNIFIKLSDDVPFFYGRNNVSYEPAIAEKIDKVAKYLTD